MRRPDGMAVFEGSVHTLRTHRIPAQSGAPFALYTYRQPLLLLSLYLLDLVIF
jgi:hypothetical protein